MTKNEGVLYIRYKKNSHVGKVIEYLKKTETNFTLQVRDYILLIRGFEVLKYENLAPDILENYCYKSIRFFSGNNEIAKINLKNLQSGLVYPNNVQNKIEEREANIEFIEPNKNQRFIHSLLPKKNNC